MRNETENTVSLIKLQERKGCFYRGVEKKKQRGIRRTVVYIWKTGAETTATQVGSPAFFAYCFLTRRKRRNLEVSYLFSR